MADGSEPTQDTGEQAAAPRGLESVWKSAWPVVMLAGGALLLAGGAFYGLATKPMRDFQSFLNRAERQIRAESYDEAIETLNSEVFPFREDRGATSAVLAEYHTLLARAIYLGQRQLGVDVRDNHANVRTSYLEVEALGGALGAEDLFFLADTLVTLDQPELAIERADALPPTQGERRRAIYRRVIEQQIADGEPSAETLQRLAVFLDDPDLPLADEAWAIARQTEIRLAEGFVEQAVVRLNQALVRLGPGNDPALTTLFVLLGEAYIELGEIDKATEQFERASASSAPGEAVWARGQLGLAKLEPDVELARAAYAAIADASERTAWHAAALLGVAESLAALRQFEEADDTYRAAIDAMLAHEDPAGISVEKVAASLLERYAERTDDLDDRNALRFANRSNLLFAMAAPGERKPLDLVLALAEVNDRLGRALLPEGGATGLSLEDLSRLDPATRAEAQARLLSAAQHFAEYARRIVLRDPEAFGDALWASSRALDLGGDIPAAVASYQEFVQSRPSDQRLSEARFRLATAYHALGELDLAADTYRTLIEEQDATGVGGANPYSDASYVPLAQVLLDDADDANDAEAVDLLRAALDGSLGDPQSETFREALIELGRVLYLRGQYPRAIERLTEALERYPEDARTPLVKFRLADAYRREAGRLEVELVSQAMPDSVEIEMASAREQYLRRALPLFEEVAADLAAVASDRRSEFERVALRNSMAYLGDCAFDLGEFERALRYYKDAAEHNAGEPAALVSMIQIVNCHLELGDLARARNENERAKRFYNALPAEAWDDPYLPMSRDDWERWLNSTAELYGFGS
ncbi:MAG: tetratricopeptide repeat protein [Planctomycetota bacterium]